jgi:hypothetical protein
VPADRRHGAGEPSPADSDALLDELVQAHLDTIELMLDRPLDADESAHVDYLRALVRQVKAATACEMMRSSVPPWR